MSNTVSSIDRLISLARAGDETAQYVLAFALINGEGIERDPLKAQMLLYKSYLRGNIEAIFALVDLYDEPLNHICEAAARHGHLKAQWFAGERCFSSFKNGNGAAADLDKTEYWLRKAAEQGHVKAAIMFNEVLSLRKQLL